MKTWENIMLYPIGLYVRLTDGIKNMSKKWKSVMAMLMVAVMLCGLLPNVAFAANGVSDPDTTVTALSENIAETISIGEIVLSDGDYLAVGATAVQSTKPDGGYAYYKDGVLTLENFTGVGKKETEWNAVFVINCEKDLKLVLKGANELLRDPDTYSTGGSMSWEA